MISSTTQLTGGTLTGRFVRHQVESKNLGAERGVTVRLPDNYDPEHKSYPVVYMHDGQNLFDKRTGFNNQEWHVDEIVSLLGHTGEMPEVVVVAVDNADRFADYTHVKDPHHGGGHGKNYENFLVHELMPAVEAEYSINPRNRVMLGSSLGGLVTASIGISHPGLCAGLGRMSTADWWANGEIADRILGAPLENGPKARMWMDMGTEEGQDDGFGQRAIGPDGTFGERPVGADQVQDVRNRTREAATALLQKGWVLNDNLHYHEPLGGRHEESHWKERLGDALIWLTQGMTVTDRPTAK